MEPMLSWHAQSCGRASPRTGPCAPQTPLKTNLLELPLGAMDRAAERNAPWDGSRPRVAQVQGLPIPCLDGDHRATCHRWQGEPRGSVRVIGLPHSADVAGCSRVRPALSPGRVSQPAFREKRIGPGRYASGLNVGTASSSLASWWLSHQSLTL